eukprot:254147_1
MLIQIVNRVRANVSKVHVVFYQKRNASLKHSPEKRQKVDKTKTNKTVQKQQALKSKTNTSLNKFAQNKSSEHIEKERIIRKLSGFDVNAISPVEGPTNSKQNRKKVLLRNSPQKIMAFLQSESDLDATVYNTAIKSCGNMKNVVSCQRIMALMKTRNVSPDIYSFAILFHALNKNNRPDLSDLYLKEMLNVYNVKPNNVILTTLLGGCTNSGDIQRAERILKLYEQYDIQKNALTYTELIHTYGQHGDYVKCQELYDEMLSPDQYSTTALMHAYLKCNQIATALKLKLDFEKKGYEMNAIHYTPFVAFYLKPTKHFNPHESLRLFEECKTKNGLMYMNNAMINLRFVAYLKLMETESNTDKKSEYFEMIKTMPFQRQSNKLQKWDLESASIVFRAHLIFYSNNFNHPEIIKYFDHLSKYLGYWCFDNRTKKWLIDFHGYSYDEVTFALYHILRRRVDELVNKMGFEWQIICGTQKCTAPTSKEFQSGIKQFVTTRLKKSFQIRSEVNPTNAGRISLNSVDVQQHVKSIRERETKTKKE